MRSVIMICTGNIHRSAYAEARARQLLDATGERDWNVSSAGVGAVIGGQADPVMAAEAARRGLDVSEHRGRQLEAWMIADADLVLSMTRRQRHVILDEMPEAHARVFLMHELAEIARATPGTALDDVIAAHGRGHDRLEERHDLPDPYRRGPAAAAAAARAIDDDLDVIVPLLIR